MNKKFFSALLMGSLLLGGTFVSCQDYDDDIENLQTQIDKSADQLNQKVSELQSSISAAQSTAEAKASAAQTVADAAKGAANDAAAAAKAAQAAADKVAADLDAANKDLAGKIEAAQAASNQSAEDLAALQAAVEANTAAIQAAAQVAKAAQEAADAKASSEDVAAAAQKAADDLKAAKEELEGKLSALEAELNAVKESLKNTTTSDSLEAANEAIKKIEESLNTIMNVVGKRLSSLVFAPKTYINGIEAIEFVNLNYANWWNSEEPDSSLLLNDGPTKWFLSNSKYTSLWYKVEDYGTQVEYLVSPDGVKLEGIKDLKFRYQEATNTRADALELSIVEKDIKGGKLILNLKKNYYDTKPNSSVNWYAEDGGWINNPLYNNNNPEYMDIVALEAVLADEVKTAEEADREVSVFSDWARVQESWEIPQIHNALSRDNNGTIINSNNPHFWTFHQIYADGSSFTDIYDNTENYYDHRTKDSYNAGLMGLNAVYTSANYNNYIAAKQPYSEPIDLLSLVTVCTGGTKEIADYKKYGLDFEFHLMPYMVLNESGTAQSENDKTNQADFAKLEGSILTATAEDGTELNANAIGRTPVIQVILKDVNKNAVIDVKYLKIKWVAEVNTEEFSKVSFDKIFGFECSNAWYQDGWVYENEMNSFYTKLGTNGIGKEQFKQKYQYFYNNNYYNEHSRYYGQIFRLNGELNEEYVANYDYTASENIIGQVEWRSDGNATTQTQNLILSYDAYWVNPRVDKDGDGLIYDSENGGEGSDWAFDSEKNFEVNGFFIFESADKGDRVYVPVKLTVKTNTFYTQYVETQWNTEDGDIYKTQPKTTETNKYRNINPSLSSDDTYGKGVGSWTTTQLVGSILTGYIFEGETPADVNGIVKSRHEDGTIQAIQQEKDAKTMGVSVRSMDDNVGKDVIFDASRIKDLPTYDDDAHKDADDGTPYFWFVYGNSKTLYYGIPNKDINGKYTGLKDGTIGAQIDYNGNICLVDNYYTWGGNTPTDAALKLVGQKVPVIVRAKQCVKTVNFDKFYFNFINPLTWKKTGNPLELVDVKTNGDSKPIDLSTVLELSENYGQMKGNKIYLFGAAAADKDNQDLINWYGIKVKGVDNSKIMTNLNKNGGKDDACLTLLSEIKNSTTNKPLYEVILDNTGKATTTDKAEIAQHSDATIKTTKVNNQTVNVTATRTDAQNNTITAQAYVNMVNGAPEMKNGSVVYYAKVIDSKYDNEVSAAYHNKNNLEPAYSISLDANGNPVYVQQKNGNQNVTVDGYYFSNNGVVETDSNGKKVLYAKYTDGKWYNLKDGVIKFDGTNVINTPTDTQTDDVTAVYHFELAQEPMKDANGNAITDGSGNVMTATTQVSVYVPSTKQAVKLPVLYYVYEYGTENNSLGTVYFHNMSDDAIATGQSFNVQIPVIIETKWEKELTGYIDVIIKSGI